MKYTIATLLFAASALAYAEAPARPTAEEWLEQHEDTPAPPLHTAAAGGQAEECRRLIADGADVNAPSIPPMPGDAQGYGETPLMLAAQNGYIDICRILLQAGAKVDETTLFECATPLFEAAAAGHTEICRLLLEAGADANACTRTISTPLMAAALNGHAEICRLLLAAGADATAIDREGDSALHAVLHGATEKLMPTETARDIISALLAAGAPKNEPNYNEETAIDLAADLDDLTLLQFLLDAEK